jgi:hypothetical protein
MVKRSNGYLLVTRRKGGEILRIGNGGGQRAIYWINAAEETYLPNSVSKSLFGKIGDFQPEDLPELCCVSLSV